MNYFKYIITIVLFFIIFKIRKSISFNNKVNEKFEKENINENQNQNPYFIEKI